MGDWMQDGFFFSGKFIYEIDPNLIFDQQFSEFCAIGNQDLETCGFEIVSYHNSETKFTLIVERELSKSPALELETEYYFTTGFELSGIKNLAAHGTFKAITFSEDDD